MLCAAFDSWIDRGNIFRKWHPYRLQPVPHIEVCASAGVAVWDVLVATALFRFLSSGAIFESTLLSMRDHLVIAATAALSWLTMSVQIALCFVAVIALLNFVQRYCSRTKLLPYIAAHVVATLGLAVLTLHPQGLVIGAGDVTAAYTMSALYTLKLLLAVCALRAAAIIFQGISDFRRLRLKDERPVAV